MFFSVDDKKLINERSKHIPDIYRKEMTNIIEGVINRVPVPAVVYEPITATDYD